MIFTPKASSFSAGCPGYSCGIIKVSPLLLPAASTSPSMGQLVISLFCSQPCVLWWISGSLAQSSAKDSWKNSKWTFEDLPLYSSLFSNALSWKFQLLRVHWTLSYASSGQQQYCVLPGIQLTVPLGSFPQAENWSGGCVTLWVSFLSGITALCCLLYTAPK